MANQEHLDILKQGVEVWNQWRLEHAGIEIDLRDADLRNIHLRGADLHIVNLFHAILTGADLKGADLRGAGLGYANLNFANLQEANLSKAWLSGADLRLANLKGADLREAEIASAYISHADLSDVNLSYANLKRSELIEVDLSRADLSYSVLTEVMLVRTNFTEAILTNCRIYGIAAWDVELKGTRQNSLVITPNNEPAITVDNLKIAQFIYLLLNNAEIREVIDTITSKIVLILGRFTPERKAVLDALRDELRKWNYTAVVFDFEKPANRDLTETVSILAHLARFIIVDLTDPSSAPHEVATIIPQTVVPVQPLLTLQPLIVDGKTVERREYGMFEDLRRRYHWVLPTFRYKDTKDLLVSLKEHIIDPAELKAQELAKP